MSTIRQSGLITMGAVLLMICSVVSAADFSIDLGWIYYQDNSGREISYDFADASMDPSGLVTIPGHAVTAPPSESGTTFLWEPGHGDQQVSLSGGVYQMAIPQATESVPTIATASITVDGSAGDWGSVETYLTDATGDVFGSWTPGASADVEYLKLAFSPDDTHLYILFKLVAAADSDTWYRLFLDNDLDGDVDEPGDYQMDIQYDGFSWDVVSQGWNSPGDWYPVVENGEVSVSGQYIEVRVDAAVFDLPGAVNVYGRTMGNADPYPTYDWFSGNLGETWGFSSLGAYDAAAPIPTEWQFAARIANFSNPGFGSLSPYLCGYGVDVGSGSSEPDDLEATVSAVWVSGYYKGVNYDEALVVEAFIENDLGGVDEYDWDWGVDGGGGVAITGLDPATTVLDLKVQVTNGGQTASFYYRVNSDEPGDWQLAIAHTLPAGVGTMYGFHDLFPSIGMETWFYFEGPVPVYRFWKAADGTHFYTIKESEKDKLINSYSHIYTYEGPVYYAFAEGQQPAEARPVYRFWKAAGGTHFYTMKDSEKDKLINSYSDIYTYEGPVFYAYADGEQPAETQPVYRFWKQQGNTHFYTIKESEKDKLINNYSHIYTYEGAVWYAYE